ncbi:MAG: hypothetical protein GEV11_13990 [Streptosporangiales bacterium]|nr:hypothetical protein [Streptosporangiales bacterium]
MHERTYRIFLGGQVTSLLGDGLALRCASVFFDAALAVTVQDLLPGGRVLPANATLETAAQLSRVLGPAAAGILIAGSVTAAAGNDPRPVFLGSGVLLAAVTITAWHASLRTYAGTGRT